MAGLNQINRPLFSGDDRYKMAFLYLDRLFPYFPQYDNFDLYKVIGSSLKDQEYKEARDVQKEILDLLVNKLYYAERFKNTYMVFLTELGRTVKAAGGHAEYIKEKEKRLIQKEESLRVLIGTKLDKYLQQRTVESPLASNPNLFNPSPDISNPSISDDMYIEADNNVDKRKTGVWPIIEKINTLMGAMNGLIQFIVYLVAGIGLIILALKLGQSLISFLSRLVN